MNTQANSYPLEIDCRAVEVRLSSDAPLLLLDCRERDEFALVHIDGAQLWPMSELADRVRELDAWREGEVVVYCHHGVRSLHVAMWLRQQGFARVASMRGGIDRWATEIDPALPRY